MANVVSKANPERGVQLSVHTPDFPAVDWFINPVLPVLPIKYWENAADVLQQMDQAGRDAVDAAAAAIAAAKAAVKAKDDATDERVRAYDTSVMADFNAAKLMLDDILEVLNRS